MFFFSLVLFVSSALASAPSPSDDARFIVPNLKYEDLSNMKSAGLETAALTNQPWSGWYWPLYLGGLAYRYRDPGFPKSAAWRDISGYLLGELGKGDDLSPAEKYDLLVGDTDFTLTRTMIMLAQERDFGGAVPQWLGYCGGWAHAAMNTIRPQNSVTSLAPDGRTIEFTPTDLEALVTLLWANGTFHYRMAGTICSQSPIAYDQIGRATDLTCRDTNPATWHLAIVNQIGVNQRALLIDADPGSQIWNHPVFSYTYQYFNPSTDLPAASLEEAIVSVDQFSNDRFAPYRAPGTRFIVGIEMKPTFTYIDQNFPNSSSSPQQNETRTPRYRYDLELDSSGKIIGGEWRLPLHPDVLWVADPGARPLSIVDQQLITLPNWNQTEPLPQLWREAAKTASKNTQLVARIVENLLSWSH